MYTTTSDLQPPFFAIRLPHPYHLKEGPYYILYMEYKWHEVLYISDFTFILNICNCLYLGLGFSG